jgi:release factor glutamine methyltransferase
MLILPDPDLSPDLDNDLDSDLVARLRAAGCVFAEDEARLLTAAAGSPDELATLVKRRAAGEPIEYVLGWAEFHGLRIALDPGVFIPRRRSEFLVDQAVFLADRAFLVDQAFVVDQAAPDRPPLAVLDLCCGSGALGLALAATLAAGSAAALGPVELHATDLDPAAVRCARRNLAAVGGQVYQGDLYQPLPGRLRGQVGILLANVPYVPTGEIELMPAEAREHEARLALDGGGDGLDVLRRVSAQAPQWLAAGGHLLVEVSVRQAPRAVAVLTADGLTARVAESDEDDATVVIGTKPA